MIMVNGEGGIVSVNVQAERLFRYTRDELIGQPVEILVPDRFRPHHPGHRRKFMAAPEARSLGAAWR